MSLTATDQTVLSPDERAIAQAHIRGDAAGKKRVKTGETIRKEEARDKKLADALLAEVAEKRATRQRYDDEVAALASNYKVEKSKLGTENIDGHSCEKNKVTVTDGKGTRQEAVVWNATDLTGFPVQMRMSQPEATVVMHFTEIQLARPDAKQFEPPTGFTKHDSMEKLVQAATLKMQGGK